LRLRRGDHLRPRRNLNIGTGLWYVGTLFGLRLLHWRRRTDDVRLGNRYRLLGLRSCWHLFRTPCVIIRSARAVANCGFGIAAVRARPKTQSAGCESAARRVASPSPFSAHDVRAAAGSRHASFVFGADKAAGGPAPAWPGFLRSLVRRLAPAGWRLARNPQASFVQRASARAWWRLSFRCRSPPIPRRAS
jgi:hypothetical protein